MQGRGLGPRGIAQLRRQVGALLVRRDRREAALSPVLLPLASVLACLLTVALARGSVGSQAAPAAPARARVASLPRRPAPPPAVLAFSDDPLPRAPIARHVTLSRMLLTAGGVLLDSPPAPIAARPAVAINPLMRLPEVTGAALRTARVRGSGLMERALAQGAAVALAIIHYPIVTPSPTPTRTATPTPSPTATPLPPTATATPAQTVAQVYVTGYALTGITATGAEAGPGICAVDPSYIALGTQITIDGLGSCVAADTGPSVVGAHIDVWVPTVSEAYSITGWYTARW